MRNIITDKREKIVEQIQNGILEKYKQETNTIFYFYSYWRTNCQEKDRTPLNFMAFLKEKLNEEKAKFQKEKNKLLPGYIEQFFNKIEFELNMLKSSKKKESLLQDYDDKLYFSEKLNEVLEYSVKRYLGMSIDEEDSDDE
jgi:hypothetical protein